MLRLSVIALGLFVVLPAFVSAAVPADQYWDNRYHANGPVQALLVHRGILYVGGNFTSIGGVAATNIARWDGTNWFAMGTGVNGGVYALAAHDGIVYAGGDVFTSGGGPGTNLVRWDGANWLPLGSLPSRVLAIAVSTNGSEVYAGHAVLGTAGGQYVFKFDGTNWTPLGGGIYYNDALSTPVAALLVDGKNVYLGGQFGNVGGVEATNLARWDGTNWWPVGGGVEFTLPGGGTTLKVAALGIADGKLYVGGNLNHVGGSAETNARNIARWDGSNWFTFNGGVPFIVHALAVDRKDLYVAGRHWEVGEPAIAKWDGTNWVQLGSGLGRPPDYSRALALGLRGADLFVGGIFSMAGDSPADNLSVWHIPQSLQFARVAGRLHISWPTQAVDYVLQRSDTLPGQWSNVPQIPKIVNERYTITNNLMGSSRVFRLYHP
jgi:hypothetical protein